MQDHSVRRAVSSIRRGTTTLIAALAGLLLYTMAVPVQAQYMEMNTILNEKCFWRVRTVWETEEVVLPDGTIQHAGFSRSGDTFSWTNPGTDKTYTFSASEIPMRRLPDEDHPDWTTLDFDDSVWLRDRGPFLTGSPNHNWKRIQARALFTVEDVNRAGTPSLSLTFHGGAVVYLNGKELTRAYMPEGDVDAGTPALPYPQDVYYDANGSVVNRGSYRASDDVKERQRRRNRTIKDFTIPNNFLRTGINVLAIDIRRAPTDYAYYLQDRSPHKDTYWAKINLSKLDLIAQPGAAILPNLGPAPDRVTKGAVQFGTGPLKDLGFFLQNQSVIQRVFLNDYPDPYATVQPVRIVGVRNGVFAAQFLVGHAEYELSNLKVAFSDLTGPGTIPAGAVSVRYALPDGRENKQGRWFDTLDDTAPRYIPMYKEYGGALQPVWIQVAIPGDAAPGEYTGTITVTAQNEKPLTIPLKTRVIAWNMPDPKDFEGALDLMQSPESVAMAYDVPLWSEKHWRLLDRTFELMSRIGGRSLYITAVRRTHMGNEHAMVRWIRDDEGYLQPDLSIVEKYIDTAMKHMGKIPGIILYGWEPPESQGHAGGTGGAHRIHDKAILFTMLDPESGELSERIGPAWGTPEAKEFWKTLTDALQALLKARGLEDSLLFGLAGDHRPTKQAMDDIGNGLSNPKWAVHSHYYCDTWQGYPMGLTVALWGLKHSPADPTEGLSFGWSNPHWIAYYPRGMSIQGSTPVEYRVKMESLMGALRSRNGKIQLRSGVRGLGRLGLDFWDVLRDSRGRPRGSLAGRYPESAWGQLNLNFGVPRILGMGTQAPAPTIRSEAFREATQEIQARVYIEKALLDKRAPQLLGEDLMKRCRATLDERIRIFLQAGGEGEAWYISSGWRERAERLYLLAAEVAARYGDDYPVPDLDQDKDA